MAERPQPQPPRPVPEPEPPGIPPTPLPPPPSPLPPQTPPPGPEPLPPQPGPGPLPPMTEYDLAIIGGGLAGAAAAWHAARRGCRVALLERDSFPRDKVCGEFLSAEAAPVLLAMTPHLAESAPRITRAAFIAPNGRGGEFALPTPALAIARRQLDAALWQAAGAAGCDLRARHGVRSCQAHGGGFELRGEARLSGAAFALRARAVIVAAGRWWRIAGLRPAESSRQRAGLGLKAHLHGDPPATADGGLIEMFYFTGGYCGFAPLGQGLWNACCLLRGDHARALSASGDFIACVAALSGSPALERRLRACRQAAPTVATAPVYLRAAPAAAGPVFFAGDAAGFLDPFTGDGMARALLGGALAGETAAEALAANEPLEAAARRYAARVAAASRRSFRWAGWLRRLAFAPPWVQTPAARLLTLAPIAQRATAATRWRTAQ